MISDMESVVEEALIANDVDGADGIHSWRCNYPPINGECSCLAETVTDVVTAVRKKFEALHRPVNTETKGTICRECSFQLPNGRWFGKIVSYPCPTMSLFQGGKSELSADEA